MSNTIKIIAANLNGCSHAVANPKFDFGIKKCYEATNKEASIILMSETMSDGDLKLNEKHSTFIIPGNKPGTGMCASVDTETHSNVEVKEITPRLQLITLAGILNLLSVYAPQIATEDYLKKEFADNLSQTLSGIDSKNDLPTLCVGDFNVQKAEVRNSYLRDVIENGQIFGVNKATQAFGKELDFAILFKGESLKCDVELLQNATSDHDALFITLKNTNVLMDIDENELLRQKIMKPVPIPKNQKAKDLFKKEVKIKWNIFLNKNPKIKQLLAKTETSNTLCKCKKANQHPELLNAAYHNMRQTIIEVAEKYATKRRKQTFQRNKCSLNSACSRYYQKLKSKLISKNRFRAIMRSKLKEFNEKLYMKMSRLINNSKDFFKLIKTRTTGNVKPRMPRIPIKKVYNLYKDIYEPEDFHVNKFKKKHKLIKPDENWDFTRFTLEELISAMDDVKKKKSSRGPKIEHWLASGLEKELLKLFNACVQHGSIPKLLLTADIRLLKKDRTLHDKIETNYRPIAIVESASKILEVMMRSKFKWKFAKNQYAYQPKIGCLNSIKDFIITATRFRSTKGISYSIFLDLSKAFDKLDFNAIMNEMESRMNFQMRRIFVEYLTNTSTNLENYTIKPRRGIRQGGLLSPYLFLQTVNPWLEEYSKDIESGRAGGYADDTSIQTWDPGWGQKCLNSFSEFANKNGLQVNAKKCKVVAHLNYQQYMFYSVKGRSLPTFYMQNTALEYVKEYKFLGYWISSCLTDTYQMNENFKKVKNSIFQFKRHFKKANDQLLVRLAESYFSSKLYGLEFTKSINQNQTTRFNYFYNIWFGKKTEATNEKLKIYEQLTLKKLHEKARERYGNIESRL